MKSFFEHRSEPLTFTVVLVSAQQKAILILVDSASPTALKVVASSGSLLEVKSYHYDQPNVQLIPYPTSMTAMVDDVGWRL